jgi:SOS response regulatory protein OraA/RecX
MSDEEYDRYLKRHEYDHPIEEEERKINAERSRYHEGRKDVKRRISTMLRRCDSQAFLDEEDWAEIEILKRSVQRENGNMRTHKKRLRKLRRHHH